MSLKVSAQVTIRRSHVSMKLPSRFNNGILLIVVIDSRSAISLGIVIHYLFSSFGFALNLTGDTGFAAGFTFRIRIPDEAL